MQIVVWGAISRSFHDNSRNLLSISLVLHSFAFCFEFLPEMSLVTLPHCPQHLPLSPTPAPAPLTPAPADLTPADPTATYWSYMRLWLFRTGVCTGEKTVNYTIFTTYSRHALTACSWHQIIHNVNSIRWNCYLNV